MGGLTFFILSSFMMMPISSLEEHHDDHAIYVSVLEIEYQAATNSGRIMIKIFANDLEDAIYNKTAQRVQLIESNCSTKLDLVQTYFNDHLFLKINGKELNYTLDACEVNDISIWYTFSFTSNENWETVELTADYLIELFPTQSNVVSVMAGDEKRMFRLTKGSTSETVKFDP